DGGRDGVSQITRDGPSQADLNAGCEGGKPNGLCEYYETVANCASDCGCTQLPLTVDCGEPLGGTVVTEKAKYGCSCGSDCVILEAGDYTTPRTDTCCADQAIDCPM